VKIAIMTGLFAKRNMNINARQVDLFSGSGWLLSPFYIKTFPDTSTASRVCII
jgi:hypothetical protein